jgi:GNAT superfamily N-acetyltransferase
MKIIAVHFQDNPYRKAVIRQLVAYNDNYEPLENWQYVGFYALDAEGQLVGGVQGNFEWDWLHIHQLWVKVSGQGLGRQLMKQAEVYAKDKGKIGILLETYAFQAKPFFEKIGFTVIGEIEEGAGPHARYFMTKRI